MTTHGQIHNGMIVLDEPLPYPEGTIVDLEVQSHSGYQIRHPELVEFCGILPADIDVRAEYALGILRKHS
ncbi:MAG: hypothetical protein NTX50_06155 [Candidatus Sumerlaeota bacterium]|nr:hypothetical protein [Candidatus Sumerlaeota bacterium]